MLYEVITANAFPNPLTLCSISAKPAAKADPEKSKKQTSVNTPQRILAIRILLEIEKTMRQQTLKHLHNSYKNTIPFYTDKQKTGNHQGCPFRIQSMRKRQSISLSIRISRVSPLTISRRSISAMALRTRITSYNVCYTKLLRDL